MEKTATDRNVVIAKNTLFMFVRMVVIMAIGLITSRVLLQTLGVNDFGLFNVIGSVVFFIGFLKNALTNATQRYITFEIGRSHLGDVKKIFSMSMNVHILLAIAIFIILEIGGVWYINNRLVVEGSRLFAANIAFQAVLANFCLEIIKVPYTSIVIAYEKMDFFAWSSMVEALLKLLILFVLVWAGFDKLILYSLLLTTISVLLFIWYYLYCHNKFENCRYIKYWDKSLFKSLFAFSGWSTMANGVDVITVQGYNLMFNAFFGVVTNAAYGISNQVKAVVANFVSNFSAAYSPQITKSYASEDASYFHKLIISSSKISGYISLIVGVPLFLNIDYLLDLWLVEPPVEAALFLKITIFHTLFDMIQAPLTTAVFATGDIRVHQIIMTIIKIIGLIISFLLLKLGFEASHVLICWVLCNVTCSIVRTIYLGYYINLDSIKYFKDVCGNLIIILLVSLPVPAILCLFTDGMIKLICSTVTAITLISFFSYMLGMEQFEKRTIKDIIEKYGLQRRKQ